MERSLFLPLKKENLTTLGVYYNFKSGLVTFRAAREWDKQIDWSGYSRDFTAEHPLTSHTVYLGHQETIDLFEKYNLKGYLEDVVELIKKGKHQGIECFFDHKQDIHFISNMHSNTLGINNGYHAIRSGGIRRHDTDSPEVEVIIDGLNLSRAMSFKNAGAQIPFGGSKITVQCEPVDLSDHYSIGFLAYALSRTRSFTGPDMGFSPELADVMRREGYSVNIAGGFDSKIGPTGGPTAYGIYLALKEAATFKYGTDRLADKTIVVQGVGAVGYPLVEQYLSKEDATIYITDISPDPVEKLVTRFPDRLKKIAPDDVLTAEADIFVPCAMGGILDESTIKSVKFSIILGAANNQLRASSQEEEARLARLLEKQGILFQVDWMHNTGGVIAGMEEYIRREKASMKNIREHTNKVCKYGTRQNFNAAKTEGITPTEMAYKYYSSKIYQ
ncbi:MAG: Glu/Leu/Phe/Val dehydrogenase dimerization domain-containing protein [Thermodesulfobacteriota bacterium]|nr:Glu/Leu/Phe/Val dehydrogenase dimerization domain-containing protein [Thermodesulfobacteriota bacterium]